MLGHLHQFKASQFHQPGIGTRCKDSEVGHRDQLLGIRLKIIMMRPLLPRLAILKVIDWSSTESAYGYGRLIIIIYLLIVSVVIFGTILLAELQLEHSEGILVELEMNPFLVISLLARCFTFSPLALKKSGTDQWLGKSITLIRRTRKSRNVWAFKFKFEVHSSFSLASLVHDTTSEPEGTTRCTSTS